MVLNAMDKIKRKTVMQRDWRWGSNLHRAAKEGHFEAGTLESRPNWLAASITFLEEEQHF